LGFGAATGMAIDATAKRAKARMVDFIFGVGVKVGRD
jgi:hypothetical protein